MTLQPEVIVFCVIFFGLWFLSFLWSRSRIVKFILAFFIFRAIFPVVVAGILYVLFML